ncbi:hypothetical protein [Serratia sp. UGAL515B_01]|uniref:hypothetical protein n=1 Tax=Serratia sp. UGAL515B_01 TaxID=2986763 RepID=UPI002952D91B|nr:hypothetical protein [Serratia sp. UGAL515B_01]WON78434.1 hypothetical protein OK023_07290 [Serratia sp. UGAL515B_01]
MENEEKLQEVLAHTIRDNSLVYLVKCANLGVGVGVTLIVEGQLISGNLVSGEIYAKDSAQKLRNVNVDESIKNTMASFFDSLAADYQPTEGHLAPLNFLHLQNPAYLRGDGGWTTNPGSILRVNIAKVSGFHLGKIGG